MTSELGFTGAVASMTNDTVLTQFPKDIQTIIYLAQSIKNECIKQDSNTISKDSILDAASTIISLLSKYNRPNSTSHKRGHNGKNKKGSNSGNTVPQIAQSPANSNSSVRTDTRNGSASSQRSNISNLSDDENNNNNNTRRGGGAGMRSKRNSTEIARNNPSMMDDRAMVKNSKAQNIIMKPFVGSRYAKDYSLQMKFWRDFCSPIRGKNGSLTDDSIINDVTLQTKWRDYCNLRFKHFVLELEPILRDNREKYNKQQRSHHHSHHHSNIPPTSPLSDIGDEHPPLHNNTSSNHNNNSSLTNLYEKFIFKRNKVGNLPNITDVTSLANYNFKNYNEIASFINNLSMIEKKYYLIWNGISAFFMSFSKDDPNFDGIWHKKIKQSSYIHNANNANNNNANNAANNEHRNRSITKQFSQRFNRVSRSRTSSISSPAGGILNNPGAAGARIGVGTFAGSKYGNNYERENSVSMSMSSVMSSMGGSARGLPGVPAPPSSMPPAAPALTANDLRVALKSFILARLAKTGLFETRSDLITAIFDGDLSVQNFDELLDYCLQEISDPSVYCRYKSDGFEYYIINRLTFAVFIGLFNSELNKNSTYINQFEYLETFFEFIWDFSVYNICFARSLLNVTINNKSNNKLNNFNDSMAITFEEPFYIKQFLFWKGHCCFGLKTEEAKLLEIKQRSLSRSQSGMREMSFSQGTSDLVRELSIDSLDNNPHTRKTRKETNFDDGSDSSDKIALVLNCNYFQQGTLLHSATHTEMLHYCRLLCENGSDIHKQNQSNGNTPYSLAKMSIKLYYDSLMVPQYTTTKARESEANYFALKNQKSFSNIFMLYLGIDIKDRQGLISNKPIKYTNGRETGLHENDLYFDLDRFDGAKSKRTNNNNTATADGTGAGSTDPSSTDNGNNNTNSIISQELATNTMKTLTKTVLSLLKDKLPISDDMITLCFEYCLHFDRGLMNEFIAVLELTSKECLDSKYINKEMQARNMAYFQQFLLKSKVWMLSSYDEKYDENKEEENEFENGSGGSGSSGKNSAKRRARYSFSENETKDDTIEEREKLLRDRIDKDFENKQRSGLLYNFIENSVANSLKESKNYIWQSINHEMNTDRESWTDLIQMRNYHSYEFKELRQDYIKNGIRCEKTEQDLWVMQPLVDANTNYDCFKEFNTKSYLTKCLVLAHAVNAEFQRDMERVFNEICKNKILYRAGPVKSVDRCVNKAESEFYNKSFPSVACITDFVRCTVTFETCQEMLNALHQFKLAIETDGGGCVTEIVGINNGFREVESWKSEEDTHFVDLKINVIIEDPRDGASMIGEIVLLFDFLLKSKKIGHSLAEIKSRSELIENVFKMEMIDNSYNLYKEKVHGLIVNRNYDYLAKELIWSPNIIMSMIDSERKPLLYHILARDDSRYKFFDLFYATMVFFHSILLGKYTGNLFMRKYLNYNQCKDVIKETKFWSIETKKMQKSTKQYKIIEKIMNLQYFHGTSQLPIDENEKILFKCVEEDCFNYLSLIFEFPIKNHATIVNGLNFAWRPFCKIFLTDHCSDEWLELLMFNFESVNIDVKINQTDLQTAYNFCTKDKKEKWANMIEAYAERTNQVIDKVNRPQKWKERAQSPSELQTPRVKNFLKNISPRIFGK